MPRAGPGARRPSQLPTCSEVNFRIDQSNETLNMFLGGRQRAWMAAGVDESTSIRNAGYNAGRPLPRPPRQETSWSDQNAHAPSTISSPVRRKERESISTSTSPDLSNVLPTPSTADALAKSNSTAIRVQSQGSSIPSPPLSPDNSQTSAEKVIATAQPAEAGATGSAPFQTGRTEEPLNGDTAHASTQGELVPPQSVPSYEPTEREGSRGIAGAAGFTKRTSDVSIPELTKRRKDRPHFPVQTLSSPVAASNFSVPNAHSTRSGEIRPGAASGQNVDASQRRPSVRTTEDFLTAESSLASNATFAALPTGIQHNRVPLGQMTSAVHSPIGALPHPSPPVVPSNDDCSANIFGSVVQPAPLPPAQTVPYGQTLLDLPVLMLSEAERTVAGNKIQSHLKSIGGRHNLDRVARLRIQILEQAIQEGDAFCLLVHQIICLVQVNSAKLPSLLAGIAGFQAVVRTLDEVLAGTSTIPYGVARFLSEFPTPIESCPWENSQKFAQMVERFTHFVMLFNLNWQQFIDTCIRIQLLPLAKDLYYSLGVQSGVLMAIIFRAVLWRVWSSQPAHTPQANELYERAITTHKLDSEHFWTHLRLRREQDSVSLQLVRNQYQMLFCQLQALSRAESALLSHQFSGPQGLGINTLTSAPDQPTIRGPHIAVWQNNLAPPNTALPTSFQRSLQGDEANSSMQRSQPTPLTRAAQTPLLQTRITTDASIPRVAKTGTIPFRSSSCQSPHQQDSPIVRSAQRLFPLPGKTLHQPAAPQPIWALHQALLRTPALLVHEETMHSSTRFYQSLQQFALFPVRLDVIGPSVEFPFNVSGADFGRIPTMRQSTDGSRPLRVLRPDALQYRLRMCKVAPVNRNVSDIAPGQWGLIETAWAPNIFLRVNDHDVELRRKAHFAKDLPVDITDWISGGSNKLEVMINAPPSSLPPFAAYALAVEVIGVQSFPQIKANVAARLIPAAETLARIQQRLRSTNSDSDDELMMVSSNMTIQLFEPFSNHNIFTIPVRGAECSHFDCFDLDIWLQSRPLKQPAQGPTTPSEADCWRCPICRGDARPQTLVVDGFLVEVRQKLEEQDLLDTRHIIVEQDGSWRPKIKKGKEKAQSEEDIQEPAIKEPSTFYPPESPAPKDAPEVRAPRTVQVIELN